MTFRCYIFHFYLLVYDFCHIYITHNEFCLPYTSSSTYSHKIRLAYLCFSVLRYIPYARIFLVSSFCVDEIRLYRLLYFICWIFNCMLFFAVLAISILLVILEQYRASVHLLVPLHCRLKDKILMDIRNIDILF